MRNIAKKILERRPETKTHTLEQGAILTKCKLARTIQSKMATERRTHSPVAWSLCNWDFPTRCKFTNYLKCSAECNPLYQIEKYAPIKRPNARRNEWCADEEDLQTHLMYQRHITPEEKNFPAIAGEENAINRKHAKQLGLPPNETYTAHRNILNWSLQ